MNDISEGHWLIEVAGVPGSFQTKSGGDVEVEHTKDFDGGSLKPKAFQGKPVISDLTIGRAFQVPRDSDVKKALQARLNNGQRFNTTVTARPVNEEMGAIGEPQVYEAVLKRVSGQEANANSSQPSRLELVFTVLSVR
jgi:hypothetical protein